MTVSRPLGWKALACVASLAAATLAPTAHADYLWLQREGAQLQARVGELHQPLAALPALRDTQAQQPAGKALAVEVQADRLVVPAAPDAGDLRLSTTRAGADGVLTYLQARFGRAETQPVNDLELAPTEPNGNSFRLYFKGRPVAASQVRVETSEGWRRMLRPQADGTVQFNPAFPGLYVLEVSARVDSGSVTVDGQRYTDVRHTATLSFEVRP